MKGTPMKKALLKDGFKQIIKTRKRFISILLMAFLGVGFFAGVKATSPDMKMILDTYFDEKNIYDVEVMSTLGLTEDDLNALSKIEGVESVHGLYSKDVYTVVNEKEIVIKAMQYSKEINDVELIDGKLPEKENECVIEK
jgi:putative ABC transport system permease protein